MKLSVAHLWPSGAWWATALPGHHREQGCSESTCRFQTSLCLHRLERGVDPHIAPPESWVQSLFWRTPCSRPFPCGPSAPVPLVRARAPGPGGARGPGRPLLEASRGSREKRVDWEPGGPEAVTEGAGACGELASHSWPGCSPTDHFTSPVRRVTMSS